MKVPHFQYHLAVGMTLAALTGGPARAAEPGTHTAAPGRPAGIVRADIVALDHLIVYNRFGSFNPFGMMFALAHDVVPRARPVEAATAAQCNQQTGVERHAWNFGKIRPLNAPVGQAQQLGATDDDLQAQAGNVRLRDCKRPRPLVLRANVGDVLELRFTNLLLSHSTRGPYGPDAASGAAYQRDDGTLSIKRDEKPGLSATFCAEKNGKRYGMPPQGAVDNDEDILQRETKKMCALHGASPSSPSDILTPPALTPHDPHLVASHIPADGSTKALAADGDWPSTRHVSLVMNGLTNVPDAQGQVHGACTGLGAVSPGETVICRWALDRDGTHFFSSQAAVAGGEGDGGSLTHGLFGALVVERAHSAAYRSQLTRAAFDAVWPPLSDADWQAKRASTDPAEKPAHARATPRMAAADYEKASGDVPILNLLRATGQTDTVRLSRDMAQPPITLPVYEIAHSVLNAMVSERASPTAAAISSFREFTAILHDELKTFYTDNFQELSLFGAGQLAGVRDGFAINYGASGMGTMLLANRKRIGPAADCVECLYEEFFLQSWANGDPALLEHYPDDPSNVHHSYLNDRLVFRNFHAGPKETHVFHLHAHQWFAGNDQNRGSYLDSQTVGPQQGFTYRIYSGGYEAYEKPDATPADIKGFWATLGSGNRNRTPGDSIFHCHLYPHFAQGMWALWRNHDVLEDGTRFLPDGQKDAGLSTTPRAAVTLGADGVPMPLAVRRGTDTLAGPASPSSEGTPIPGLLPLPDPDLPPPVLPTYGPNGMPGFPFYIPGQAGRRAPQPPMDIARNRNETSEYLDGGLPRHVVDAGVRAFNAAPDAGGHPAAEDKTIADGKAMIDAAAATLLRSLALGDFSAELHQLRLRLLPYDGDGLEQRAMAFHYNGQSMADGSALTLRSANGDAAAYDMARGGYTSASQTKPFVVNGAPPRPGAPFADPCALPTAARGKLVHRKPDGTFVPDIPLIDVRDQFTDGYSGMAADFIGDPGLTGFRRYEASAIQTRMVVNRAGWHDPQARINILSTQAAKYKTGENNRDEKFGNLEPFFFRATSGECIEFRHTNELPKDLDKDDFQVRTPTDTIGQHIHLVKFDVTSADGSGNGWNYEDGTFAPDEVAHRICAALRVDPSLAATATTLAGEARLRLYERTCVDGKPAQHEIFRKDRSQHRKWFQTTVQRWFADPVLSTTGRNQTGTATPEMRDRTLRTVFTHDHFGPSSIQQHGFYSALVIEPQKTRVCRTEKPADAAVAMCETPSATTAFPLVEGSEIHVGARRAILPTADQRATAQAELNALYNGQPNKDALVQAGLDDLNVREYMLAIADFATLYDPYGKKWTDPTVPVANAAATPVDAKGLDCLLREASARVASNDWRKVASACDGAETTLAALMALGDVPPAMLAALTPADVTALVAYTRQWRAAHGAPIAAPRRPESISVDHHDPYLVNYRNEPLPLRVGTDKTTPGPASGLRSCRDIASAPNSVSPLPAMVNERSIAQQRSGEEGDMANVFRSSVARKTGTNIRYDILHSDPCTPMLEAYTGEKIQVRLIQGAQEVQHMFTLEGYALPRNIDQRFPSRSNHPEQWAANQAALNTRHRACWDAHKTIPLLARNQPLHSVHPRLTFLRENCDNVDGRVAAQEIGISEHFEIAGAFNSQGTNQLTMFSLPAAQPVSRLESGDSLYHFGTQDALWNGAWGLLRIYDAGQRQDFTQCLAGMPPQSAPSGQASPQPPLCPPGMNPQVLITDRLPKLAALAPELSTQTPPPGAAAAAFDADAHPWLSITCPVAGGAQARAHIAAIAAPGLRYNPDAPMRDNGALRFVPATANGVPVTGGWSRPLVLRVNAGDCLTLTVFNQLPALNGGSGNAHMPKIVPLNTDQGAWNDAAGTYKPGSGAVLTPSQKLAISIPLSMTVNRQYVPAPFGVNYLGANSSGDSQTISYFAGTMEPRWDELDARLAAGVACGATSLKLEPARANTNSPTHKLVDILGRHYKGNVGTLTPDQVRQCIMPAIAETKRPQGYAFGPLPLKSFGDVIGHASRGLYGMVIVEPKGTQQARIVNGVLTYTAIPTAVASSSVRLRYPQAAHPGSPSPDADPAHQDSAVTLPPALVSEHALVWQDGLTLHAPRIGGGSPAPVADCHVCDDSYDFGKRGVSYRAGMLTARLGIPAIPQTGDIASTVNGAFDLNKIVIPKSIYSHTVKALHLPPLVSQPGDEVMFRLLHPAGRARQRAFVMTGAGYDDLFPGFGFPSAALLAPGKALTAHLWRKAAAGECQLWRDGPSLMVGQGVWGLHGVPSAPQGQDACAKP